MENCLPEEGRGWCGFPDDPLFASSATFCDSQLRLLFTRLEKSSLPIVRSNLMIATGDLAIRFPNLVDPWTPHLYAR